MILGSVVLGLLVAPGRALGGGRLAGVLWAIPATQVAHYAAVTLGLVVVLWLCGQVRGRAILLVVVAAVTILLLTHTRTALVGVVAGILVAGLSLIVAKARVRKFFVGARRRGGDRDHDVVQRHHAPGWLGARARSS